MKRAWVLFLALAINAQASAAQVWHSPRTLPFHIVDNFGVRSISRTITAKSNTCSELFVPRARVQETHGLDLRGFFGDPVYAVADGKIASIVTTGSVGHASGGNQIELITNNTFSARAIEHKVRYLHLSGGEEAGDYQYVGSGNRVYASLTWTALPAMGGNGIVIWRASGVTQTVYLSNWVNNLESGAKALKLDQLRRALGMGSSELNWPSEGA